MQDVLRDDSMLDLQIDSSVSRSLENGSWWAKFISIVAMIGLVLIAIILLFAIDSSIVRELEYRFGFSGIKSAIWIMFIVIIAIAIVVIWQLLSFANKTNRGVKESNQDLLERGIGSLKIYLFITGVFSVIGLLLTLLGLFNS